MDNKPKHQEEMESILQDLADILKSQGKSDKEIDQELLQLVTHVEMAVVDEIYNTLPEDKKKQLEELGDTKKSSAEYIKLLQLDPEKIQEIEMRKFEELADQIVSKVVKN
jgi:DNA repair ATPase RecN